MSGFDVSPDTLDAEALAGEPDWVWAMVRFHSDGSVEVSSKIQRRRSVVLGVLGCMGVAGTAGLVLGLALAAWAR